MQPVANHDSLGPDPNGHDHDKDQAGVFLRLEGINKWFRRGNAPALHVLRDINLSLQPGEVLVLVGASGAGKSTLLRCINMLTPPDTGRLLFLGKDWLLPPPSRFGIFAQIQYEWSLRQLRSQIGMVFQHFNLFPHMTAWRNVAIGLVRVQGMNWNEAEELARAELARVGLAERCDHYPSQLSGGEKQRVAIARALAMGPKLMLFDEVTSALDPELTAGVLSEMRKLALAGMTMIVVTHEMSFAREVGDRVAFMESGCIIEEGPARQVIRHPNHPRTRAFLDALL